MHGRKKEPVPNPWNKNPPPSKRSTAQNQKKTSPITSSELRFKEATSKLQAAVQKHVQHCDSSSEEEELQTDSVIAQAVQSYKKHGGADENLVRTQSFLQDSFDPSTVTCLICISKIKRDASIWYCFECYCIFHLDCIQRWSKDSIVQRKQTLESPIQIKAVALNWGCPKCRFCYQPEEIPREYRCFCQKTLNPKYDPFLLPHSCGEICKKPLKPICGHKCLLLCHPGPCPPCPVTVNVSCYCGSQAPKTRRCCSKEWSCANRCGKLLPCEKHTCSEPCHAGECGPCAKKSLQKCLCKSEVKLRDCASPLWQCDKICNKPLQCGNHLCTIACHEGDCPPCPLTETRTCPCGKSKHQLPCTEETPTCPDTCDKLLDCGIHTCNYRCHNNACGQCLEIVEKSCRCGSHKKEVHCSKPYLCETKCKRMKDCNKHPCNRKCCDGSCPPCEKPCARSLKCNNHKCMSVCHQGPCFPCNQTEKVTCRCGKTSMSVPCGRRNKTRPPHCTHRCSIPPDCHHTARQPHKCHFGECPPCNQVCGKPLKCGHTCPAPCHSCVLTKVEDAAGEKASMPWEQTGPQLERRELPCPECVVPVQVTCLGEHETADWPCHLAVPSSCQRPCGRQLECGNHTCTLPCHAVEGAEDETKAGTNCETCENPCTKPRPEGCPHECPRPCHPGACEPCQQMVRIKCHCGLSQPYVKCSDWLDEEQREQLQSCGNQCPKSYECGHRCRSNCHSGPCPDADQCKKKVKVFCKCKRIKKEFSCETVRKGKALVECDDTCEQLKEEERKTQEVLADKKKKEEELKNQIELEKFQRKFEAGGGKRKNKEKRVNESNGDKGFLGKYWLIFTVAMVIPISVAAFYLAF